MAPWTSVLVIAGTGRGLGDGLGEDVKECDLALARPIRSVDAGGEFGGSLSLAWQEEEWILGMDVPPIQHEWPTGQQ